VTITTSVLIPTYNSAKTIAATLESVFSQTITPGEILIMDDGSTDNTVSILRRYTPRIKLFQQSNRGVAYARNVLCQHAQGDLLAFLDHDDVWHPRYLVTQQKSFESHADSVGFFTGHHNFWGVDDFDWETVSPGTQAPAEIIAPSDFLRRYHKEMGKYGSMSYCCVPRHILTGIGDQPFCQEATGVDDFSLFHALILLGPIVFNPEPLVAYRITPGAQSASLLASVQKAVRAMELLEPRFRQQPDLKLKRAFNRAFASQRREYGRVLMGTAQASKARKQLWFSMTHSCHPASVAKSFALLFLTCMPNRFQPKWPSERKVTHSQRN
jgi:glycosyltransferase involved in cell wall biosynthesis